jgi:hypothetical protein
MKFVKSLTNKKSMPAFGNEDKNAIVDAIRFFADKRQFLRYSELIEEIMEAVSVGIKYAIYDKEDNE